MKIEDIPFNAHLGIVTSKSEGYILEIDIGPNHLNHIGTAHASVIYGLAEATSGEYLLRSDKSENVGGVVRRSSSKYSKPTTSLIRGKISNPLSDLETAYDVIRQKGKALLTLRPTIHDCEGTMIASFEFTWFLTGITVEPSPSK